MYCRSLTSEQKALIKAYAETDKDVKDGTIDGITNTVSGLYIFSSHVYKKKYKL